MKLSIIIPAYNESKKIVKDILLADAFFSTNNLIGEIIVVDDGSSDGTFSKANEQKEKISCNIIVLRNEKNMGKGNAVRKGILKASGQYCAYCDAGYTVPFSNLLTGIKLIEANICDIAHGSRRLSDSIIKVPQANDRKISSKVIRIITKNILGVPDYLTDTQCGFKIYKKESAHKIYADLKTNGFMFEVENILRSSQYNLRIKEFPIEWSCDRDSRITLLKTPWKVLKEIIKIKFMRIG